MQAASQESFYNFHWSCQQSHGHRFYINPEVILNMLSLKIEGWQRSLLFESCYKLLLNISSVMWTKSGWNVFQTKISVSNRNILKCHHLASHGSWSSARTKKHTRQIRSKVFSLRCRDGDRPNITPLLIWYLWVKSTYQISASYLT